MIKRRGTKKIMVCTSTIKSQNTMYYSHYSLQKISNNFPRSSNENKVENSGRNSSSFLVYT